MYICQLTLIHIANFHRKHRKEQQQQEEVSDDGIDELVKAKVTSSIGFRVGGTVVKVPSSAVTPRYRSATAKTVCIKSVVPH